MNRISRADETNSAWVKCDRMRHISFIYRLDREDGYIYRQMHPVWHKKTKLHRTGTITKLALYIYFKVSRNTYTHRHTIFLVHRKEDIVSKKLRKKNKEATKNVALYLYISPLFAGVCKCVCAGASKGDTCLSKHSKNMK